MEEVTRVRLPRGKEIIGVIDEILGASRFTIRCVDGNKRICRLPGKFRARIRVRVGDVVIVEPWDIEPKEKGDVIWIYNRTHAAWLHRNGYLKV